MRVLSEKVVDMAKARA